MVQGVTFLPPCNQGLVHGFPLPSLPRVQPWTCAASSGPPGMCVAMLVSLASWDLLLGRGGLSFSQGLGSPSATRARALRSIWVQRGGCF